MRGERDLLDLISAIYEAAVDSTGWHGVLERIGDAVGHASVALVTTEDFDMLVDAWQVRHDPAYLRLRLERYSRPDSNRGLRAFMEIDPLRVVSRKQFQTDRELEADPFFDAIWAPQGLYYACIATLYRAGPLLSAFGVYRPRRFGDFNRDETEIVEQLVPHLARALWIHRHLATDRIDRRRAEETLNLLSAAIWLLAEGGRIIFANRRADALLQRRDGLTSRAGKLAASHHPDHPRLTSAVAAAARDRRATVLPLRRGSERRPLQVWVAPLPREKDHAFGWIPASDVLVLAVDPESRPAPPIEALRALHPLTDAEARLARGLLDGERLEDYAARAEITMNTAKSHLKAVFAKTDTSRQAELVRVLSSALPRFLPADRKD